MLEVSSHLVPSSSLKQVTWDIRLDQEIGAMSTTHVHFPVLNSGEWTTGICGCFDDWHSCCCGFCCPCVLVGRTVEILDQGATSCCTGGTVYCLIQSLTGCGFLFTCGHRGRLRQKFGLPETPCGDCLTEFLCHSCATCQAYRELKNRNIDPALGYEAVRHIYEKLPQAGPPSEQVMTQ